jgi:hypothetical protein
LNPSGSIFPPTASGQTTPSPVPIRKLEHFKNYVAADMAAPTADTAGLQAQRLYGNILAKLETGRSGPRRNRAAAAEFFDLL